MKTSAAAKPRKSSEVCAEDELFEMQVRICKAFANATRLRILDMLGSGEQTCSGIQQALGITAANMSQHLAILRGAGIVATRRDGKQIYCSLAMPEVKRACEQVRDVLRAQVRKAGRTVLTTTSLSARASGRDSGGSVQARTKLT